MATDAATSAWPRSALRDPVLLVPAVVAAGLAVGFLGSSAGARGIRVAADIALSWGLVAASVVALERARWRRPRVLLAAAAFALLAADLQWADATAVWTLGFLFEGLWVALLVQLVLTFPDGRPWSRAARLTIAAAYAATIGGQVAGAFVDPESRDVLSVTTQSTAADIIDRAQGVLGIAVALALFVLVAQRMGVLRGPARRAQAPLLVAAVLTVPVALTLLAWMTWAGGDVAWLDEIGRLVALILPLGLVAGVSWSRLRRSEASDLVVELGPEEATSLRERLADVLGDPTVELAYRLADGRYVDASGEPLELPTSSDRAITLVTAHGEQIAALIHDPALLDEPALVESVRTTAGLVLENERLAAEVRSQLAEVRASRTRIVAAADAERRRIERNLHDGAQQRLVTLSLALGLSASRGPAPDPDVLARAQDEVEAAIGELRELARGIHPTLLREEGLESAVRALARRTPLPVAVDASTVGRLPDTVELAAYFLVSEALANVVKHARASRVEVLLARDPGTLRVAVTDDGAGGARATQDSGLAGLHDRLEALDAKLAIASEPGVGTIISAEIPCAS
ncbi:MAG TPA: histidine kinase [Gaiellales bacterium]|jgi:signal transduction histidine kinase|nr:histidine kinase [Gaiellales bacterium]